MADIKISVAPPTVINIGERMKYLIIGIVLMVAGCAPIPII